MEKYPPVVIVATPSAGSAMMRTILCVIGSGGSVGLKPCAHKETDVPTSNKHTDNQYRNCALMLLDVQFCTRAVLTLNDIKA